MANLVLVERLLQSYDPWCGLCIDPLEFRHLQDYEAVPEPGDDKFFDRCDSYALRNYDYGRIRFLAEQMKAGWKPDALSVDNVCSHGRVHPEVVLLDGQNRLAAAEVVELERIKVSYSGRVDLLRWLQGRRKTRPE